MILWFTNFNLVYFYNYRIIKLILQIYWRRIFWWHWTRRCYVCTVKPLNSGHPRVLKNLLVIERCLLLAGNLKKIVLFGTQHFVWYLWHVCYLGCPLLGGFTALLLDLLFTIFHSSTHLSFLISISITACWFLISSLRHWFYFSSILILSFWSALSFVNFLLIKFLK